jgi:hypothetical protein
MQALHRHTRARRAAPIPAVRTRTSRAHDLSNQWLIALGGPRRSHYRLLCAHGERGTTPPRSRALISAPSGYQIMNPWCSVLARQADVMLKAGDRLRFASPDLHDPFIVAPPFGHSHESAFFLSFDERVLARTNVRSWRKLTWLAGEAGRLMTHLRHWLCTAAWS